jgi:hypothetical protein
MYASAWTKGESYMATLLSEFAGFVTEPPIIEIGEDKIVAVRYRGVPERVMSVRTLTRAVERGQRALRQHAAGEKYVIVDD